MNMTIDNFEEIKKHLTFETQFDRYIIHVIKRAKDEDGRKYGVNETNRLLKTFFITSLEYFDKKIPVIKDLCESNKARAYILPQVRNNSDCLKELLKIVVDNLDNPTIKPDHLIRNAYCGLHKSRDKKWILDLDNDGMIEYKATMGFPKEKVSTYAWTAEMVLNFIREKLKDIGKKSEDAWMVPTKNGNCIVTSPFNLQSAYDECNMMFQGVHKVTDENGEKKDITGWLIKDGMVLCYYSDGKDVNDRKM